MNIFAYNPPTDDLEKTFLAASTNTGATVFKVKNSNGFTAGKKVLVGAMSRERSEILTVASVTPTQITLGAAKFPHSADDPIYALQYDKIKIYVSTTGINGTYNLLETLDVDVDNASGKTVYRHVDAAEGNFYRVTYYDSVNDQESEQSQSIETTGYPEDTAGRAILDVASRVGDKEFMIFSIEDWLVIINDISEDILTQAKRPYRFLRTKEVLDVTKDENEVAFPANLWKVDYVEVNKENPASTATFRPKKVSPTEIRYRQSTTPLASDDVYEIAYDDVEQKLLFNPAARTDRIGAFNLYFYKKFNRIKFLTDILETPNNQVYKLGMLMEWYQRKSDDDNKYLRQMMEFEKRYNAEIMKLQREKNIDAGGPSGFGPDRKRYRQWGGPRYRQ